MFAICLLISRFKDAKEDNMIGHLMLTVFTILLAEGAVYISLFNMVMDKII